MKRALDMNVAQRVPHIMPLICLTLALVPLGTSCDRSQRSPDRTDSRSTGRSASSTRADENISPMDTVRRVHHYRLAGQIGRIEPYLWPEQRAVVVELIQAVDRLVWANEVLQAAVTKHLGPASAGLFDRSQVANIIGVFSKDVELVDQRVNGEQAVVTIQVAAQVPLEEVHLVRRHGRWLIRTDSPIPAVAGELRNLADALIGTARRVEREQLTVAQLRRELEAREAPIGRRLAALTRVNLAEGD